MTRARNIAGFSTITTTPSPVHVGPIGVLTATRIDGEFNLVDLDTRDITAQGIGVTNLQTSGITTSAGLNVSGVGTIATLNVTGNATVGGVLTYEDVTNIDSIGIITARSGMVVSGVSTFSGALQSKADVNPNAVFDRGSANTTNVNVNYNGTLTGQLAAADGDFQISAAGASTPMSFYVNGSERASISSAGLVSIPVAGNLQVGGTGSGETDSKIYVANTGGNAYIQIKGADSSGTVGIKLGRNSVANRAGIDWSASTDALVFRTGGTGEKVRITNSGRVGINSEAPTHKLAISDSSPAVVINREVDSVNQLNFRTLNIQRGSLGASSASCLQVHEASSIEKFRITQAGKVGIDSTSPTHNLDINSSSNPYIKLRRTGYNPFYVGNAAGDGVLEATDDVFVKTGGNETFRVDSNGVVLIGNQGTAYGRLNVPIPTQSGGAAVQVMNTAGGSGDGTLTNIVLRSVNSTGSQWAHSQYRSQSHAFQMQSTTKVTINSNGLCFNSDTAAANALDDYEKGTWTPQMHDGNGSNVVLTVLSGRNVYVKIGELCYISGNVTLNDTGKSGVLVVTHLPFNSYTEGQLAAGNWWVDHGSPSSGLGDIVGGVCYKTGNDAKIYFVNPTNGASNDSSNAEADTRYWEFSQWTNGRPVYFNLTYRTS